MEVTVTAAVSLTVERYNELIQAEPYRRLMADGFADLVLVSFGNTIRITVPDNLKIGQIADASTQLMAVPKFGKEGITHVRNVEGILLERNRAIRDFNFKYGERLFVETV